MAQQLPTLGLPDGQLAVDACRRTRPGWVGGRRRAIRGGGGYWWCDCGVVVWSCVVAVAAAWATRWLGESCAPMEAWTSPLVASDTGPTPCRSSACASDSMSRPSAGLGSRGCESRALRGAGAVGSTASGSNRRRGQRTFGGGCESRTEANLAVTASFLPIAVRGVTSTLSDAARGDMGMAPVSRLISPWRGNTAALSRASFTVLRSRDPMFGSAAQPRDERRGRSWRGGDGNLKGDDL